MADSGFTGRSGRWKVLKAAALAPIGALLCPKVGSPADYASAGEALAAIDVLEGEVVARLRALEAGVSPARAFAASLKRDHDAHRRERDGLRERLGLGARASSKGAAIGVVDLEALRAAQERLTFAHAEALPALANPPSVQVLARHMVDLSRHLTLLGLWIEAEERRG
jgi:hypothetical protein